MDPFIDRNIKRRKYTLTNPFISHILSLEAKKYTLAELIFERNNVPKQHFLPALASGNNDVEKKSDEDDINDGYNAGNNDDDNHNI